MASVTFVNVGNMTTLQPNATTHWKWNNAPDEGVWAISVDPYVPLGIAYPKAQARVEVTRVEYRHIYHGKDKFEREIHFWFKNTGTIQADCLVHMALIRQ